MHVQSEQYISNIDAAPTCFGADHAPSSGSSRFLIQHVHANVVGAKTEINQTS
jgi:hypothetical protein